MEIEAISLNFLRLKLDENNLSLSFSDTAILRFLRGSLHDIDKAFDAMVRHARWREEFGVDSINETHIQTELDTKKVYLHNLLKLLVIN